MMHRWKRPVAAAVLAVQGLTGCFRYVPAPVQPAAGTRFAVEVTDEGRVALAGALGPGIIRVEGVLVADEPDAFVIDAAMVTQLRLRPTSVDNIRVRVAKAHVERAEQRQLSRRRTLLLVGGAAVAVVSFFVSKGWFGRSTPPDDGGGGGGPDQSRGVSLLPATPVEGASAVGV